jgi:choline dehydrogenase-like flavoprotein
MIVEPGADLPDLTDVDVCIVGGGAAGITLAVELSGSGRRVVLLQEGGLRPSSDDERVEEVLPGNPPVLGKNHAIGSYLGGNTNHWYGNSRPLEPVDFMRRPWVPHSGWPVDGDELGPFYERAAALAGLGPSEMFEVDSVRADLPDEARPAELRALSTRIVQTTPVFSFADLHVDTLRTASDVVVLLGCHVRGLVAGPASAVEAVNVVRADGSSTELRARRFVLAGGGLENARLLLVSPELMERTPPDVARNVGRYFQEHWYYDFGTRLRHRTTRKNPRLRLYDGGHGTREETVEHYRQDVRGAHVWAQLVLSEPVAAQERLPGIALWFSRALVAPPAVRALKTSVRRPRALLRAMAAVLSEPLVNGEYLVRKALMPNALPRRLTLIAQVEQVPDASNRVTLSTQNDRYGDPEAALHVRLDDEQRRHHARALEIAADDLGLDGAVLAREMEQKYQEGSFGYFWHHMGTTRMSDDPRDGVVDRDCRVHGWDNLFVAGSSVFPTSGTAGPTLTIVALASRLAAHLSGPTG